MSLLDYIAKDPNVQIFFIVAVAALIMAGLIFFNVRKTKKLDHDLRVIEPINRNMPVVRDYE